MAQRHSIEQVCHATEDLGMDQETIARANVYMTRLDISSDVVDEIIQRLTAKAAANAATATL